MRTYVCSLSDENKKIVEFIMSADDYNDAEKKAEEWAVYMGANLNKKLTYKVV